MMDASASAMLTASQRAAEGSCRAATGRSNAGRNAQMPNSAVRGTLAVSPVFESCCRTAA